MSASSGSTKVLAQANENSYFLAGPVTCDKKLAFERVTSFEKCSLQAGQVSASFGSTKVLAQANEILSFLLALWLLPKSLHLKGPPDENYKIPSSGWPGNCLPEAHPCISTG